MDCSSALERLLEADLDVLHEPPEDDPLAVHLRHCEACRAQAARFVHGAAALAAWLEPPATFDRALPRPVRRRVTRWPLAAAAALALLLAGHEAARDSPSRPAEQTVDVTLAPGQNALVFRTSDPTITVVWFY